MKKVFMTLVIFVSLTSLAFAGGDKVRGEKGKGSTGTSGGGSTTQTRGNQITTQFVYIKRQGHLALPFSMS